MLTRLGIAAALAITLTACATPAKTKSAYQTYVDTYTQAAANPPKVFEFECPDAGCNFKKMVVYQTGGSTVQGGLQPPAAEPNVGLEIFREVKATLLGVMPWYAGMRVLDRAFSVANQSSAVTNTSTTTDNSNRSVQNTSTNTTSTSTSTSTTTSNSNNVSHTCQTGNSQGGGTGPGGATGSTNC